MSKLQHICSKLSRLKKVAKVNDKNVCEILKDFNALRSEKLVSFQEYSNYRLANRSSEFRETFLSYAKAETYWDILNPKKYACLARDKYISHCLLDTLGIPTSTLIAYYNPESASITEKMVFDYDKLAEVLRASGYKTFVIKPATDSAHGEGVIVCRELIQSGKELIVRRTNGSKIYLRELLGSIPLLFETLISQTEEFSTFNKSSLNTVRIMTALYPDHSVRVFAGFIKIGRQGSDVDNAGSGGNIDCGVNVETGQLYNPVQFNSWEDIIKIKEHPDSKAQLDGYYIKDWKKIKERLQYFQGLIPQLKTIGWDVAITESGPVIVEINNWWDTTGQEFIDKGWGPEVKECYHAWVKYYSEG